MIIIIMLNRKITTPMSTCLDKTSEAGRGLTVSCCKLS